MIQKVTIYVQPRGARIFADGKEIEIVRTAVTEIEKSSS